MVVADGPGFVVNRILGPYLNEAGWLLADGATIEEIDAAARAFGMPMGPIRLLDEIGLDIARHAGSTLHEVFGERLLPSPPLQALANTERLGRKNGRGFYRYEEGRERGVDPSVYDDLAGAWWRAAAREVSDEDEIRIRLVLSMVNEAARTLADRVVQRAGDLDLAMIMGAGFPPFRGGLLRFADSLGPTTVRAYLDQLHDRAGPPLRPRPVAGRAGERGTHLLRGVRGLGQVRRGGR